MQGNENLSEATAEAVEDFYSWIADMPLDEAMTALRGIKQYEKDVQAELFRTQGRVRYED
jgi:hypothetical protein